jgi:hypothetical protein
MSFWLAALRRSLGRPLRAAPELISWLFSQFDCSLPESVGAIAKAPVKTEPMKIVLQGE